MAPPAPLWGARAYTLTHAGVYAIPPSTAGWPVSLTTPLVTEQPYRLFSTPADWMAGQAFHVLVSAPAGLDLTALGTWAAQAASAPPAGLAGAYLLAGAAYVCWWELWEAGATPASILRNAVAALGTPVANGTMQPVVLTAPLDAVWPGFTLQAGDLFNFQFNRSVLSF